MTAASNVSTAVNAFATAVYSVNSVFKGYGPANLIISGLSLTTSIAGTQIDPNVSTTGAVVSNFASFIASAAATQLVVISYGGPAAFGAAAAVSLAPVVAVMAATAIVSTVVGTAVTAAYDNNYGGFADFVDGTVDATSQAYHDSVDYMQSLGEVVGDILLDLRDVSSYEDFLNTDTAQMIGDKLLEWSDNIEDGWEDFKDSISDFANNIGNMLSGLWDELPSWPGSDNGSPDNPGSPGNGGDGDGSPGSGAPNGPGGGFPNPLGGALGPLGGLFDNPPFCPLIFDLDGSGNIELTSLANSNAFFDMDSDGFAEHTGWVAGGDGILAIDSNADGIINDIGELFGNATTDGFVELAELDDSVNGGNGDGVINASDSQFADLRIWKDADSDGITDAGELKTLSDWGITEINLSHTTVNQTIEGHTVSAIGSFTMNGQQEVIKDLWFQNNQAYSFYIPDANFAYDEEVFDLPNARGYGDVPDLWVAMTQDSALLSAVQSLTGQNFTNFNYQDFRSDVETILLKWTGGEDVAANSRGNHVNAQHLAAVEALMGRMFDDANGGNNPNSLAGPQLEAAWDAILNQYAIRLLTFMPMQPYVAAMNDIADVLQAEEDNGNPVADMTEQEVAALLDPIMNPAIAALENHPLKWVASISYDYASDSMVGDFGEVVQNLIAGESTDASDALENWLQLLPALKDFADALQVTEQDMLDALQGSALSVYSEATLLDIIDMRFDMGFGTAGNDNVTLTAEQFYFAGKGNDSVKGSGDEDILQGGLGDDTLEGGYGDDLYLYNLGDGDDVIYDFGGANTLQFGAGITADDLTFSRVNNNDDLLIEVDGGGSVLVENHFDSASWEMDTILFDGGSYTDADIMGMV